MAIRSFISRIRPLLLPALSISAFVVTALVGIPLLSLDDPLKGLVPAGLTGQVYQVLLVVAVSSLVFAFPAVRKIVRVRLLVKKGQESQRVEDDQRRISAILESITDGFVATDRDWRLTYFNGEAERLTGRLREDVLGKNVWKAFPEAVQSEFFLASQRALERQTTVDMEVFYAPLDRWIAARVYPSDDGVTCYFRDISVRKRIEEALRRSEERYRSLIQAAADPIFTLDGAGTITSVNPAFERLTGWDAFDWVGKDFTLLAHREDVMKARRVVEGVLAGETVPPTEILVRCSNHDYLIFEIVCAPLMEGASIVGVLGAARDITERKRLERDLAHMAAHDSLTDLYNRRSLVDALRRAVARASRGIPSALLIMDLDRFKPINDLAGHHAGDEALLEVAKVLREQSRTEDVLARLGGDEFAVLLEGGVAAEATMVAERMRRAVEDTHFCFGAHNFRISLSVGLTVISDQGSPEVVLAQADAAMYRAKALGRNRVVVYRPEEQEASSFAVAGDAS